MSEAYPMSYHGVWSSATIPAPIRPISCTRLFSLNLQLIIASPLDGLQSLATSKPKTSSLLTLFGLLIDGCFRMCHHRDLSSKTDKHLTCLHGRVSKISISGTRKEPGRKVTVVPCRTASMDLQSFMKETLLPEDLNTNQAPSYWNRRGPQSRRFAGPGCGLVSVVESAKAYHA
jgi:hypothetical protein